MQKGRALFLVLTLAFVSLIGMVVALYARGYRLNSESLKVTPSGILVVKSSPDSAQIFINGELKTATNANVSLPPGTYDVSVRKEGYIPWNKRMIVEKEVVTEITAHLFKTAPSLNAITFSGVTNPIPSNDMTKIAYLVLPDKNNTNAIPQDLLGLWVIETVDLPLGFARDPRRITDGNLEGASWEFSPNDREILLTTKSGSFLLDVGTFTPQNARVNISLNKEKILSDWGRERELILEDSLKGLPEELSDILRRKTSSIVFSPDSDMILYTASAASILSDNLIPQLPGASTQKQDRNIEVGKTYVYDIKEDRNFLIDEDSSNLVIRGGYKDESERRLSWFATSRHLILAEDSKIVIMDYDGINRQEVYSGSFVTPDAFPTVSIDRLIILTNLGANSTLPNLYSLSVK